MKKNLLLIVGLIVINVGLAQPYNFSQTQTPYSDLTNATVLTTSAPWTYATTFTVPVIFGFDFMGTTYYQWYVEGGGFTFFDVNYYHLALPFMVKLQSKGSIGSNSPISYQLDGVSPNRILKVQWKNAGFYYDTTSTINFQTWIYETSNILEVHVGPGNVPNPTLVYQENDSYGPVVGLFEFNSQNNCTYSNWLSGAPNAAVVNNPTGSIWLYGISLSGTPASGTVYIFDPNANSIAESSSVSISLYPNPASDFVAVGGEQLIESCGIYSMDGSLISTQIPTANRLFTGDLPTGMYLIEIETQGVISRQKLLITH